MSIFHKNRLQQVLQNVKWKSIAKSHLYLRQADFFSVTGVFHLIKKILGQSVKALSAR
jgi:hypothetical protein